eukprot:2609159-Alexandrium_andersonii.AAC.1
MRAPWGQTGHSAPPSPIPPRTRKEAEDRSADGREAATPSASMGVPEYPSNRKCSGDLPPK